MPTSVSMTTSMDSIVEDDQTVTSDDYSIDEDELTSAIISPQTALPQHHPHHHQHFGHQSMYLQSQNHATAIKSIVKLLAGGGGGGVVGVGGSPLSTRRGVRGNASGAVLRSMYNSLFLFVVNFNFLHFVLITI